MRAFLTLVLRRFDTPQPEQLANTFSLIVLYAFKSYIAIITGGRLTYMVNHFIRKIVIIPRRRTRNHGH